MRRNLLFALVCGLTCGAAASAEAFSGEAEAALVSDYRWRGLSLSDEEPSLQLQATGSFDNGAWAWGGVNSVSDELGGAEIGLGLGFDTAFAALDWSFGVMGYVYPDGEDLDYAELDASVSKSVGALTASAGVEYAPEQENYAEADTYAWARIALQVSRFTLHGQIGSDDSLIEEDGHAIDYSLGARVGVGHFAADLTFVESEAADSAWVLRLSQSFSTPPH